MGTIVLMWHPPCPDVCPVVQHALLSIGCVCVLQSGRRLLQAPAPPPPPSQEEQTLEQILAAVTALQTGQTSLQTDIDALQVQVNAANAAAAANAQDTSLQVLIHCIGAFTTSFMLFVRTQHCITTAALLPHPTVSLYSSRSSLKQTICPHSATPNLFIHPPSPLPDTCDAVPSCLLPYNT